MEKRVVLNEEFEVIANECEAMEQYKEIYGNLENTIKSKVETGIELDQFEKMILKSQEAAEKKLKTAFLKDELIYFVIYLKAMIDGSEVKGDLIIKYNFLESKISMFDSYLQLESEDEFDALEEVA